jgi:hypothetical protein
MDLCQTAITVQTFAEADALFPYYDRPQNVLFANARYFGDTSTYRQEDTIEQLNRIADLPADWDGYGALRIPKTVIATATAFLESGRDAMPMPEVMPNPNGTISFLWEATLGKAHLEIGNARFSLYMKPISGATTYAEGTTDSLGEEVAAMVASFLDRGKGLASSFSSISTRYSLEPAIAA